jgi:hypothetical protein
MRNALCSACGKTLPLGQTLRVFDQVLCEECAQIEVEKHDEKDFVPGSVVRQIDPTVCGRCQMDNGDTELPVLAGFHACDNCYHFVRYRPFPLWLKAAFGFILVLLVVGLVRNWPYFRAYMEWHRAQRLFQKGDIEGGMRLVDKAAARVPGSGGLGSALDLLHSMNLLREDRAKEALPILQRLNAQFPGDQQVKKATLQAEMAVAFDDKDYDQFLKKAQDYLALEPQAWPGQTAVSSAFACKYAMTGNEEFKKQALSYLDRAEKLAAPGDTNFKDMKDRIRYRLDTREIISREEYIRRVSAKNEESQP